MNEEIEKIRRYLEEGSNLWKKSPDKVLSREFYELWENIQQPKPFVINDNKIKILDQEFFLPEHDTNFVGHSEWDWDEECAALILENEKFRQKFLLSFLDGIPSITDCEPEEKEETEIPFGEQLDIVFDVIAYTRKHFPDRDVLGMTKKEFLEGLAGVEKNHSRELVAFLRRSSAHFIKVLIQNAAQDMAADELSDQLSLGLYDSYSVSTNTIEQDIETIKSFKESPEIKIHPRTSWTILNDLEYLRIAAKKEIEAEKEFILPLKGLQTLKLEGSEAAVSIPAINDMPLNEGDILNIFERGFLEKVGTLRIDIFDGKKIYGRLRMDGMDKEGSFSERLFARPAPSPKPIIASMLDILIDDYQKGFFKRNKTAFNFAIGIDEAKCKIPRTNKTTINNKNFDEYQNSALEAACSPSNDIVLVQGPPGTGKTMVLEAVLREMCKKGLRILLTAPSNTALDNICRRVEGLPLLRFGANPNSITPDILEKYWINNEINIRKFKDLRMEYNGGGIYAGTHVGLMKNQLIDMDYSQNGSFDVILFDEAGMSRIEEFLICAKFAKRAILFGDHRQLPPFPLSEITMKQVALEYGPATPSLKSLLTISALEWLAKERQFPLIMLKHSYRCQNPRLLRFASTLFYDAAVKTSAQAEYYKLPYTERQRIFPQATVRLYKTSGLPFDKRRENLRIEGTKPGIENPLEAEICAKLVYEALEKYPLEEITVITPYRLQVRLIRKTLDFTKAHQIRPEIDEKRWENFLHTRIATVDSFQGGESDIVIISYVRSNEADGIGFIDDPNRVNVAHTRCRREIAIIADIECLKRQANNNIFERMERAIARDGVIFEVENKTNNFRIGHTTYALYGNRR